jgi:hypothetical protein
MHRQSFPWGDAEITNTSDGLSVRFMMHQLSETLQLDSNAAASQVPSYSCFVQVPADKEMTLQVQRHSSHRIAMSKLNSTALSTLSKLAENSSAPLVHVQGFRWFRGKRLAQLFISAYTHSAQGIQTLDTVEAELKFKSSSTFRNPATQIAEDKHFKPIVDALVLNAEETGSAAIVPLPWVDSTRLWLPRNSKAIKCTIPSDGVYRLTFSDLTAVNPELSTVDPATFRLFNKGTELPLYVKSSNAGQYDYVEFVGTRNYNGPSYRHIPAGKEEYVEYLNRYTDTSYYWLTWGGAQGKRYISNDTSISHSIDSIQWYTEVLHLEQNGGYAYIGGDQVEQQNPFWTSGDIWYWGSLLANNEFDASFEVSKLSTLYPTFRLYLKVANYASNYGIFPVSVLKTGINSSLSSDTTAFNQFEQKLIQKVYYPCLLPLRQIP